MPNKDKKNAKIQPQRKVIKSSIYSLCLLGKLETCQKDPKKSSTEKKSEHIPSGCSWVLHAFHLIN